MILRKQVIKHFFCNFILNNHVSAVYLRKKEWIHRRHCVDVSDDITSTKAIRRVNAKMFSVLILVCQHVTHYKTICDV